MVITSLMTVAELPEGYDNFPIFFVDVGKEVYLYNQEKKLLEINPDCVQHEMLERVIAATSIGSLGIELTCRSIDTPVYFPVGTHVKKLPKDYVSVFCNHVREVMSLL